MNANRNSRNSVPPIHEKENHMTTIAQSISPVQNRQSRFLLSLTIGTWIIAAVFSIYSFLDLRNDLSGAEWLGSPLFGLPLLAVLVTAYYFWARNKSLGSTVHVMAWLACLLLVTVANMWALARFVFGEWKGFQFMPVMGVVDLFLLAAGVYVSRREKSRGYLFLFLVWSVLWVLLVEITFAFMDTAFHSSFWRIGIVAGSGAAMWIGLLLVAYFGFRSRLGSFLDALVCWSWCIAAGAIVEILPGNYFLTQKYLIPLYVTLGTAAFAFLMTVLKISARQWSMTRKTTGAT
jgi:hypothetical protein